MWLHPCPFPPLTSPDCSSLFSIPLLSLAHSIQFTMVQCDDDEGGKAMWAVLQKAG